LWGRYTWSEQDSSAALALKGSRINTVIPAKNLGVGYTRTFGPSTVLTALFGFSSTTFNDAPSFTSRNLIGEGLFKGFANDPRALTPGFNVPGYFNLSMRNRKLGPQRGFQEHADLSHNFGSHSLKFGGEVVRQPWTNTQITENLTFNTRQTADLNSLGTPARTGFLHDGADGADRCERGGLHAGIAGHQLLCAGFLEGDQPPDAQLRVALGHRAGTGLLTRFRIHLGFQHGQISGWNRQAAGLRPGSEAALPPGPQQRFHSTLRGLHRLIQAPARSVALLGPRFGFAWQAQRRTVVRGSFGCSTTWSRARPSGRRT